MKQAKVYEKKVRNLLRKMSGASKPAPPAQDDPVRVLIEGILQAGAGPAQAAKALQAIEKEYIDYNELRVSPLKDIVDCIRAECPGAKAKAEMITTSLNGVYARTCDVSLAHLAKTPRRELRRLLSEMGMGAYAAGYLMLAGFGHHAVPVDRDLADCLQMDGYVHPDSDPADIQAFLERIVPKSKSLSAHEFFRGYVHSRAKPLAKKRQKEAEAAEKVRKAQEEAEAERKRIEEEAERKRLQAEAEAAAKSKKAARAKAAKKARNSAPSTGRTRGARRTAKAASKSKRAPTRSRKAAPKKKRARSARKP